MSSGSSSSSPSDPTADGGGCGWCRGYYYAWSNEEPEIVAVLGAGERTVRVCRRCGSYWLENVFTFPEQISDDYAQRLIGGEL